MDEQADIALLEQHLQKTNLLSQRMTAILAQLDARLSRLDKTITPLGLQPLTIKANNIDALLSLLTPKPPLSIQTAAPTRPTTASSTTSRSVPQQPPRGYTLEPPPLTPVIPSPGIPTGTPADETAIVTRGPDIVSLNEYFSALDSVRGDLERMWKGLREGKGGTREAGVKDMSKLVQVGFEGLSQLLLKIAREGTARTFDPAALLTSGPPTPPNFFPPLNTVSPITKYLQAAISPIPTRTREIALGVMENTVRSFAEIRVDWIRRSLSAMLAKVEEVDGDGIWEVGKEKVGALVKLWEVLLPVMEAETLVITALFPASPPPLLFPTTFLPVVSLISSTLTPNINIIKRSLSSHTFFALELFRALGSLQPRWESTVHKCLSMLPPAPPSDVRELHTPLSSPISGLRGLIMRSFPERLVDIKISPVGGPPESTISDVTYTTLTYLEMLPSYHEVVEGLLGQSHAERSWLMGSKEIPSTARSAADEGGLLNLFVADVLGTLLQHLETRAGPMRKPIGSTFLLNNLSHIRNTTSSFKSDVIGPNAEGMLNKAFRDAKLQYMAEWTNLASLLTSPPTSTPRFGMSVPGVSGSERNTLKESATLFFDRLSELEQVCTQYPLSRQDPDLRDRLASDVDEVVATAYRTFVTRCQGKQLDKYLRATPEEVSRRIYAVFR
ncbi:hypothetical protein M231_06865 [Tremella mesenterica]|uniref:Exocyst complex protein EXO70 n=1 Tax=Tremella mesenterica TaxID=5217 RepID=A0A4Q1BAM7_TREME|nr:uncharacterized protein TREMEDRAFT_63258 [Tremella mesenterica DSM 1558]EIW68795.1 hypothetical protein TREMEDRAFT_63258 [Tremella mesenterica DSM 1558]RXK35859.1 hypothetical protein M231_06865 [Tremella mesenterica]